VKTRHGFVSNSSSSSFIVGTNKPLTTEVVMVGLGVTSSPGAILLTSFADWLIEKAKPTTVNKLLADYGDDEDCPKAPKRLAQKFKHLYTFRAGNEDCDGWSEMLYNLFEESKVLVTDDIEICSMYGG
jgi:hypothetical protein